MIYIARIIKRTAIEKREHNETYKSDLITTYMFDEIDKEEFYQNEQAAEDALFHMIQNGFDYRGLSWSKEVFNFMYGNQAKWHSSFTQDANNNRVDYFGLLCEKEVV